MGRAAAAVSATPDQPFTDQLWAEIGPLRAEIDRLEFLRRLGDGSLELTTFRRYLEQDLLYLDGYAKALALLAARAPSSEAAAFWAKAATDAVAVEAGLHRDLLSGPHLPPEQSPPEPSPACLGYVSYLVAAAAREPYEVAAAAALPCFWIYADVGERLADQALDVLEREPEHPFARWVASYGDPAFAEDVARARGLVDAAADATTDAVRASMLSAFVTASRYEYLFWDTVLHPQPWPGEAPARPEGANA